MELSLPAEIWQRVGFCDCASILFVRLGGAALLVHGLEHKQELLLGLVIAYEKKKEAGSDQNFVKWEKKHVRG